MPKTTTPFSSPDLTGVIEKVLQAHANPVHQRAFAHPQVRQRLVAYVWSRLHCLNTVGDYCEPVTFNDLDAGMIHTLTQVPWIESLIQQGIHVIVQQEQPFIVHHSPDSGETEGGPSHWFG